MPFKENTQRKEDMKMISRTTQDGKIQSNLVRLHIGNVSKECGMSELQEYLGVESVEIAKLTGKPTTYAFAYVSPAKQKQVLKKNGLEFFKHALKIEISKVSEVKPPSTTLRIRNLSYSTNKTTVQSAFPEAVSVSMARSKRAGFCFVQFNTIEDATAAKDSKHQTKLKGNYMNIDFAKTEKKILKGKRKGESEIKQISPTKKVKKNSIIKKKMLVENNKFFSESAEDLESSVTELFSKSVLNKSDSGKKKKKKKDDTNMGYDSFDEEPSTNDAAKELLVENLAVTTTELQLWSYFSNATDVKIQSTANGRCGYVKLPTALEAKGLMKQMNGKRVNKEAMKISLVKNKDKKPNKIREKKPKPLKLDEANQDVEESEDIAVNPMSGAADDSEEEEDLKAFDESDSDLDDESAQSESDLDDESALSDGNLSESDDVEDSDSESDSDS